MYDKEKLLLAFEYGINLREVAVRLGLEMTTELVARTEKILLNEFEHKTPLVLAQEMGQNLLAALEPKD